MTKRLTAKQKAANKAKGIKGGRPTRYNKQVAEQAKKLCLLGATDKQLAEFFKVTPRTIENWKTKHPEFFHTLKDAKNEKDSEVERSLLERATGYSHKEEKIFCHQGEVTVVPTTKHYPPDTTAMIFWLKNRQPDDWRDKQELEISERPLVKRTEKRFDGED